MVGSLNGGSGVYASSQRRSSAAATGADKAQLLDVPADESDSDDESDDDSSADES